MLSASSRAAMSPQSALPALYVYISPAATTPPHSQTPSFEICGYNCTYLPVDTAYPSVEVDLSSGSFNHTLEHDADGPTSPDGHAVSRQRLHLRQQRLVSLFPRQRVHRSDQLRPRLLREALHQMHRAEQDRRRRQRRHHGAEPHRSRHRRPAQLGGLVAFTASGAGDAIT
ncbi:hypothetical protein B0J12DRAFT_647518 [Macrophomina phaseolina]|uniref:Uncharacterized protein n=1 Tax=Macrophomina phaseolina TaxID=35725 RepID=A0ABQ8GNL0_9PEZI|nr:hypothetical protein B0J12DRAFT_647518 [Macrophomina phaseolina]